MAKQRSIIKLEGTIGDITFLKTRDGYLAKEKTHISADRIANDPAFERTRENNAEFGRAGKASKTLRTAFRTQLQKVSDSRMVSRLTKEMMRVIQADATNDRGKRNVIDGEAAFLEGFDFNVNGKLSTTLYAPFNMTLDRVTGNAQVSVPAFIPTTSIAAPSGTTHFRVLTAAGAVDFENNSYTVDAAESAVLPWDNTATDPVSLDLTLPAGSTQPLFLVVGVEFLQMVNGNQYPLKNGAFNALGIVKVDA
ncbi:MAG: hypothetical protein ACO1OO_04155 [Flavisolibacter sp.]